MTMICKTIEQMQRVASAGAIKMHQQGYTYEQNDAQSNDLQTAFTVKLPANFVTEGNPATHLVTISPDTEHSVCSCSCQFYRNHRFGLDTICKHIAFVLAEERDRAQAEALELAEIERQDAYNLIESNERAHGSEWHHRPCHYAGAAA